MICFDTMVLIWGVQGVASSGQEDKIERTKRYIQSLAKENARIMVPTPVLAEYLQGFDEHGRKRQLEILERHFLITSFDLPAASVAASLARRAGGPQGTEEIPRQSVKTDFQILATAIVHGAKRVVTDEKDHFESLAAGRIQITDVPNIAEQHLLDL